MKKLARIVVASLLFAACALVTGGYVLEMIKPNGIFANWDFVTHAFMVGLIGAGWVGWWITWGPNTRSETTYQ